MKNLPMINLNVSRRRFIGGIGLACGHVFLNRAASAQQMFESANVVTEELRSDPEDPVEFLRYQKEFSFAPASVADLKNFPKKAEEAVALLTLEIALEYAKKNINRTDNEKEITEFLNVVDFDFKDAKGVPVFYCAAGISFSACRAFAQTKPVYQYDESKSGESLKKFLPLIDKYYFHPSASVQSIRDNAADRKTWAPNKKGVEPKPGWLVIFTWSKERVPNHIGIVRSVSGDKLQTVEFNTTKVLGGNQRNGGYVAVRTREINSSILGYVKLYS